MEMFEKITIRCFVLGMGLVFIWFLLCLDSSNLIFKTHSKWFGISIIQLKIIHYYGLMFTKVCCFVFCLIPYIACKWAGKKSGVVDCDLG